MVPFDLPDLKDPKSVLIGIGHTNDAGTGSLSARAVNPFNGIETTSSRYPGLAFIDPGSLQYLQLRIAKV